MNKKKIRQILVYCLLAFVVFLYVFSIGVFLFGDKEAALAVFAYSTFFTVVVYFLALYQKRLNAMDDQNDVESEDSFTASDDGLADSSDDGLAESPAENETTAGSTNK